MTKDLDDLTVGVDPEATPVDMTAEQFEKMRNRLPLVSSPPPEPPPVFTPEQTTRAEALRVSRDVMLARGSVFGGSKVELAVAEVVDLAMYIVDGTHPLERYDEPAELRVRSLQGEEIVVDTEA